MILYQQRQHVLCILTIRFLLAHSLGADLGGIPDPQLKLQLRQQTHKLALLFRFSERC